VNYAFILPIVVFFFIFILIILIESVPDWRIAFLKASGIWGLTVTIITEALSIFNWVTFWGLIGAWSFILLAASLLLFFNRNKFENLTSLIPAIRIQLCPWVTTSIIGILLIVFTIGIIAIKSPPNNYDAMAYHMSRVMHWIQNRNINHYPTSIQRQLFLQPWSEYAILQFQLLSQSDRLANLVQWFSVFGSIIGVSVLARIFGAEIRGQVLSSVFASTLPMAILQGSSTQNDAVVGFWVICFIVAFLQLIENESISNSIYVGLSLGLAFFTKATAYIYCFPIVVMFGFLWIRKYKKLYIKSLVVIFTLVLATNINFLMRNYITYGNPLGPQWKVKSFETEFLNETYSIPSTISNLVRNISIHLGTMYPRTNTQIENFIRSIHKHIGFDPDDERTTWMLTEYSVIPLSFNEDLAGNPIHFWLVAISMVFALFMKNGRLVKLYILSILLIIIIFSVLLKWQLFHSRLHLPIFFISSPLFGYVFSDRVIREVYIAYKVIVIFLFLSAIPWIFRSEYRPLVGEKSIFLQPRHSQLFMGLEDNENAYINTAKFITKTECSKFGLILWPNDMEYPFWALIRDFSESDYKITHIHVNNESRIYRDELHETDMSCIIVDTTGVIDKSINNGQKEYKLLLTEKHINVYGIGT